MAAHGRVSVAGLTPRPRVAAAVDELAQKVSESAARRAMASDPPQPTPDETPEFLEHVEAVLADGRHVIVKLTEEQVGLLADQAAVVGLPPGDYARQLLAELLERVDKDALDAAESGAKPSETQH